MTNVAFINLRKTFELYQEEYEEAALRALRSGWYIMGEELASFEKEFATYLGMNYCIGVGNGLSALILTVRALGIGVGDEVIVAANTYIATVLAVTENGATPVFVDCNEYFELDETLVERAVTPRTKAVLTTNLYGQCSHLTELRHICDERGLWLLEDCAQSQGAHFDGKLGGSVGDVSCFSFYPTKPLGAFGDAGAVVTNDAVIAEKVRMLRNYGSKQKYVNEILGVNSRLDELQAAMLRVGLKHLEESNAKRHLIAERYMKEIDNRLIELPRVRDGADHVYHIFPVLCEQRDELSEYLLACGVQTQVHYPIPPHLADCYKKTLLVMGSSFSNTERFAICELSLPIYAGMPEGDVDAVVGAINSFKKHDN